MGGRDAVMARRLSALAQSALRKDEYEVGPVGKAAARELIRRFHYARGCPCIAVYWHGLYEKASGKCVGAAVWTPPSRGAAATVCPDDPDAVLGLSRLVVAPGAPKNAASFLLGRSVRLIRADGRYRHLLTYADEYREHTGRVYRAANWRYAGLTEPSRVFARKGGGTMSRKDGCNGRTRTHAEMRELGCKLVGRYAKHKYVLALAA